METTLERTTCAACRKDIDAAAKLCPFCDSDPVTGERDPRLDLADVPLRELTASENVLAYARRRQGLLIAVSVLVFLLVLGGVQQWVTARNAAELEDSPAVPLTEITDLSRQTQAAVPMPELEFAFDGNARTMQTFIVEPGAAAPAPPQAATAVQPPVQPRPGTAR